MSVHRVAAIALTLAACTPFPPNGTGGTAERFALTAPADAPLWVTDRLDRVACLDAALDALAGRGALAAHPARAARAEAERRRTVRAFAGGLPQDGEIALAAYADEVEGLATVVGAGMAPC